jgi:hypothetical protein
MQQYYFERRGSSTQYRIDIQFLEHNDADGKRVSLEESRILFSSLLKSLNIYQHCNLCALLETKRRQFRDRSGREKNAEDMLIC